MKIISKRPVCKIVGPPSVLEMLGTDPATCSMTTEEIIAKWASNFPRTASDLISEWDTAVEGIGSEAMPKHAFSKV